MTSISEESIYKANQECLRQHRPELYEIVRGAKPPGELFTTTQGLTNICYSAPDCRHPGACAYNENPWQDAGVHLKTVPPDSSDLIVFIGMGLGYGPLLLMRERPDIPMLVIMEPDAAMLSAALRCVDLQPLITSQQVEFFVGNIDYDLFDHTVARLAALEDTHILRHPASFIQRPSLYDQCNEETYERLNNINVAGSTIKKCGSQMVKNCFENLGMLPYSYDLHCLRDLFKGIPAVLAAAGPSLTESLDDLRRLRPYCLLIAVDSALPPLLRAGITPDFVTSIDYQELNFEKVTPFINSDNQFSLVCLSNVTPLIPKRLPCRHLFFGFQDSDSNLWAMEALGIKTTAPNAFSVAHFSHGLAQIMGANPLIFIGQDLAFTGQDSDHADGVILHGPKDPTHNGEIFEVEGLDGGTVRTDRQLLSLRRLLEDNIAADTNSTCFNASAFGAQIKGAKRAHLNELADEYCSRTVEAGKMVDKAVSEGVFNLTSLLRRAKEIESEDHRMLRSLNSLIKNGERYIKQCRGLPHRPYNSLQDLPQPVKSHLTDFDRLNNEVDARNLFWQRLTDLTFSILADNDRQRLSNDRLKAEKGFIPWLLAELKRINTVNKQRRKTVEAHRKYLTALIVDLQEEIKLSRKQNTPEQACQHLRFYLKGSKAAQAATCLIKCRNNIKDQAGMKYVLALLKLDYATACHLQRDAADFHIPKWVANLRDKELNRWQRQVIDQCPAESAFPIPSMLSTWLQRIVALCNDAIPRKIIELWRQRVPFLRTALGSGNDLEKALAEFRAWRPIRTSAREYDIIEAEIQLRFNQPGMGPMEVEEIVGQNQTSAAIKAAAALYFIHGGDPQRGVQMLTEAVNAEPGFAYLWIELGENLLSDNDPQSALSAFERAFMAQPRDYDILVRMGDCYRLMDMHEAARTAYEKTLQKEPSNTAAKRSLQLL